MTRVHLLQKYGDSADVVDTIIQEKKDKDPQQTGTHVKPHPDAPKCEVSWLHPLAKVELQTPQELTLYLVWDSESEVTKEGTLMEVDFTVQDVDSDSEIPRSRKKRKARSSSEELR